MQDELTTRISSDLGIKDLPIEEQENFPEITLPIIQFATVYSDELRLKKIISRSSDFIYCVALSGVTGDRVEFLKLEKFIKSIKSITDKKIYCGFGIKSAEDAARIVNAGAEGVIVGSAIAEIYQHVYPPDLAVRLSSSIRTRLTERSKEDLRISNAHENRKEILKQIGDLITNIKNAIV